ncbi:phosphatase PAP2 family protein [Lysobacter sp. SG-8]|uniref:undecaprenyl-diphosphate phosphatase n=1 Tax=Marilutibacter penaei TaxID=2759900 RepID=A0A7W3U5I1_9GAMM|nr:phosphatase PAP2 family protein [Lysobacter penaei]MBB1088990.1 phosphatase PAP2 family protein [Lysobacter penaei]
MPEGTPDEDRGRFDDAIAAIAAFVRRRAWMVVLLFVGLLLPMWGFAELADEIHENEAIPFDDAILHWLYDRSHPTLDRFFVTVTQLGYTWFVVPFDILLTVGLATARRYREAIFAGVALAGSGLLNMGTKLLFARARPALWESIAPEHNYSFPSGHAMGSMTLAWVLVLLAWPTRARWWVVGVAGPFVFLVGMSRLYLGVHYPSDILAGWAAASLWTVSVYLVVFRGRLPWGRTRLAS